MSRAKSAKTAYRVEHQDTPEIRALCACEQQVVRHWYQVRVILQGQDAVGKGKSKAARSWIGMA